MLRLTVLALMVASAVAALGNLNALRGHHHHHNHKHNIQTHKDLKLFPAMRFQKVETKAKTHADPEVAPTAPATEPKTVSTDNVAREGLGENVPYKGIDYLGIGYDLIVGNPEGDPATKIDAGFRRPVIELEWSQDVEHNSRDLRDLQPMHGWAMPAKSCNQASSSQTISSSADYEESLSVQASVEAGVDAGYASGSFKASGGFNSFKKDVLDSDSYRFQMTSYCIQWKAGLNKPQNLTRPGYKPVSEFVNRAKELPKISDKNGHPCAGQMIPAPYSAPSGSEVLNMDGTAASPAGSESAGSESAGSEVAKNMVCDDSAAYQKWEQFFKDFGTHFIHYVEAGGKMMFQIDVTSTSMTSHQKDSYEVALEIEGEYGPVVGAASVAVQGDSSSVDSNSNMKKKVKVIVLGGTAPDDPKTGFGEWAASVPDDPMPVKYKFLPIYYAGSEYVDQATFNLMADRYQTAMINGNVRPDTAIKDRRPAYIQAGESWVSTGNGQYLDSDRNILKLESDGRVTITSRQGLVLWDSMFIEVPKMSSRPSPGAYELKLLTNGNLVLQRLEALGEGEEPFVIWQSITSSNSCNGKIADKVEFKNGLLTVKKGSEVLWTSKTHDSANQPARAEPKYFGYGENKCVTTCATLFVDANFEGYQKVLSPFPVGSGYYKGGSNSRGGSAGADLGARNDQTSSLKMHLPKYQPTDSLLSKAGVDGAECILHVWNEWDLNKASSGTTQTRYFTRANAAGKGTANKYGAGQYDYYTRDTADHHKLMRDGTSLQPFIPNDQISSAVVQLATDVQRWRCLDDIKKSGNRYASCSAWVGANSIHDTFDDFNNRMNQYFSRGCGCAMKMAQCPYAVD